jgi:hypothetical protein
MRPQQDGAHPRSVSNLVRAHGTWPALVARPVVPEGELRRELRRPLGPHHEVVLLVDELDLAVARAIRYVRGLRPDGLRAVHFVLDQKMADRLLSEWLRLGLGSVPLELVECPDRDIGRAALIEAAIAITEGSTCLSAVIPHRVRRRWWVRAVHGHETGHLLRSLSRLDAVTVTLVPYQVGA